MVNLVLVPQKTLLCHRKFKRFRYFSYIVSDFLLGLNLLHLKLSKFRRHRTWALRCSCASTLKKELGFPY